MIICTGFHRSATSATANYLLNSGVNMGGNLLSGCISNSLGHFEDQSVIKIHDEILKDHHTNWQFHDEIPMGGINSDVFEKYILAREEESCWGFKDPRAMLFLNEWFLASRKKARYVFVIRHWSGCIESLLKRHSMSLSNHLKPIEQAGNDLRFWVDPCLAAKMWISYNIRLLKFLSDNPNVCLTVTQRGLSAGVNLIGMVNDKFAYALNCRAQSPFDNSLINDMASVNVKRFLPNDMLTKLEEIWDSLLLYVDNQLVDEKPVFYFPNYLSDNFNRKLNLKKSTFNKNHTKPEDKNFIEEIVSSVTLCEVVKIIEARSSLVDVDVGFVASVLEDKYKKEKGMDYCIGLLFLKNNEDYSALENFLRSIENDFKVIACYMHLANIYERMRSFKLSGYFYNKCIESSPDKPVYYTAKAGFMKRLGKYNKSCILYEKAIELGEKRPAVIVSYADCLEKLGGLRKSFDFIYNYSKNLDKPNIKINEKLIQMMYVVDGKKANEMYKNHVSMFLKDNDALEWLVKVDNEIHMDVAKEDFLIRVESNWFNVNYKF